MQQSLKLLGKGQQTLLLLGHREKSTAPREIEWNIKNVQLIHFYKGKVKNRLIMIIRMRTEHWSTNAGVYQNHLGGFIKTRSLPHSHPRVSKLICLKQGLKTCISNKFLGDTEVSY